MNNTLVINQKSDFKNDNCYKTIYDNNNNKLFQLQLSPDVNKNKNKNIVSNREEYLKSLDIVGVVQSNSYSNASEIINKSTEIRNGIESNANLSSKKELDTRLFPGAPLVARGQSILKNPDLSSRLKYGEDTRVTKSNNVATAYSADNFIPLVPHLAENVQNVDHIIPTYWVRGGMSTRTVVRNIDYLKSCGIKN